MKFIAYSAGFGVGLAIFASLAFMLDRIGTQFMLGILVGLGVFSIAHRLKHGFWFDP